MIIQRVQRGKVGREVDITEQELDGFLATEGAVKELSPELFVRQILVSDQNKANSLLMDIDNGADFANLAKESSTSSNASSGGEMGWRNLADLPSLFADALKNKKKGYISPPLKGGSGYFILKLEDKRGDLVRFEEQWNVRHILMMTTKLRDATFTKKELEEVRARVVGGEDFSLLAKEYSEDPGSASRGGDLDWLSLGKTAPAFEKMMLESPVNEISPVFESEFGFHFLQVLETRTEDLTEEVVFALGKALGTELINRKQDDFIIARDGRVSSPQLFKCLSEGVLSTGSNVLDIGIVPSPVFYHSTFSLNSSSGAIITGSHNPADYNGFKIIFNNNSTSSEEIQLIKKRIVEQDFLKGTGNIKSLDAVETYVEEVINNIKLTRPLNISIDCGNGAAGVVAERIYKSLGCQVQGLFCDLDGEFPNHHPDPSKPENVEDLIKSVAKNNSDIGL